MSDDAAVNRRKDLFQRLVFLDNLLFINAFLRHINRDADRPHHASVQVIQWGFVRHQCPYPGAGLHQFFGHAGSAAGHDLLFGFDTCRGVVFHIPDISVAAPFHLLPGLAYGAAEAGIDLFMNAMFVLVPDKIWHMVDRCFQIMLRLPQILALLIGLAPSFITEPDLFVCHWRCPDLGNL